VGLVAFVVDFTVYNVLLLGPLDHNTITAKVISVTVATVVAWLGNRYLIFRGLGIAALCLFVSHYVFGFVSPIADNIAANGVGLVLGTTFRYFSYRFLVFSATQEGIPA